MNNYLILGAGIAGRRAAEAILERDSACKVTLVEPQPNPFYLRPMLGEFIARNLEGGGYASRQHTLLDAEQVEMRTGFSVVESDPEAHTVTLDNREVLSYDKLLIATGRKTAARTGGDFTNAGGIVHLDQLADVEGWATHLGFARRAVVYGSSFQSVGAIRALLGRGVQVTLVLPGSGLWPDQLDSTASQIIEAYLQSQGVTIHKGADVLFLEHRREELQEVLISSGIRIPAELLVMTSPQTPIKHHLSRDEATSARGIEVDISLRTSNRSIFAAGDIAHLPGEGESTPLQTGWLRAWHQGAIAGANMAGGDAAYTEINSLRTRVLDLNIVALGESAAGGEGVRVESGDFPFPELPHIYKALTYRDDRIVGATFIGEVTEAGVVEEWIKKGLKASACDRAVIDKMFGVHFHGGDAQSALCPVCKFQMQLGKDATEGTIVTCPACGIDFRMERMPNGTLMAVAAT